MCPSGNGCGKRGTGGEPDCEELGCWRLGVFETRGSDSKHREYAREAAPESKSRGKRHFSALGVLYLLS